MQHFQHIIHAVLYMHNIMLYTHASVTHLIAHWLSRSSHYTRDSRYSRYTRYSLHGEGGHVISVEGSTGDHVTSGCGLRSCDL